MTSRWYVVQTKHNQERLATDQLKNQNFEVFYPAYQRIIQKRKQVHVQILPLYPSYVFVRFDIENDSWRCIKNTRGVQGLIGMTVSEEHVSHLPAGFVEAMLETADHHGLIELKPSVERLIKYQAGEEIELKDNRYNGLVGKFVEQTGDRITLLLSLLSRQIKVSLSVDAIKPRENS